MMCILAGICKHTNEKMSLSSKQVISKEADTINYIVFVSEYICLYI